MPSAVVGTVPLPLDAFLLHVEPDSLSSHVNQGLAVNPLDIHGDASCIDRRFFAVITTVTAAYKQTRIRVLKRWRQQRSGRPLLLKIFRDNIKLTVRNIDAPLVHAPSWHTNYEKSTGVTLEKYFVPPTFITVLSSTVSEESKEVGVSPLHVESWYTSSIRSHQGEGRNENVIRRHELSYSFHERVPWLGHNSFSSFGRSFPFLR